MKHTRTLLLVVVVLATTLVPPISAQSAPQLFQQALSKEQGEGKPQEAIQLYRRIIGDPAADRALKARALLQIGRCHEKLGNEEARKAYDDLLRQYPDQQDAATQARSRLAAMAAPASPSGAAGSSGPVARKLDLPSGVPSPDGQYFAYHDDGDLTVRDLRTGQTRKIVKHTEAEELEGEFIWTRDSKRIVYNWFYIPPQQADNRERYDLRVVNVDGSDMKVLVSGARGYIMALDCSPAGTHVAIALASAPKAPGQLGVVALAGGPMRSLKSFSMPIGSGYRGPASQAEWP